MGNREELIKEREKLKGIEDAMRKEAEAVFNDFRLKYEYKVTKTNVEKRELIFYRGNKVDTLVNVTIKPAPGVMHEYTGLSLKARKVAPYMQLNLPVLRNVEHIFLVDGEGKIVPYKDSYASYQVILAERSMCIEPTMKVWIPDLQEDDKEKVETCARWYGRRIAKIEAWIKAGYPDGELVWIEEIDEIVRREQ